MDNFEEFYKLLNSLYTKEDIPIVPNEKNFSVYFANRYISMYHPKMCVFINETMNDYEMLQDIITDPETLYKMYKAVIPKLPVIKTQYIKRPTSKAQRRKEVTEDDIKQFATLLEVSTREVREYLKMLS